MSAGDLPPTSLIIPTINRPRLLEDTVDSVLAGSCVPSEIVIIDQSVEPNAALSGRGGERCDIRYIHTDRAGVSRARNLGIEKARHDVLVFTDDDVHVTADWFTTLVGALIRNGRHAVVTGQVRPAATDREGVFVPSTIVEQEPVVHRGRIGQDVIYPHSLALYRSAFGDAGAFDPRLGGGAPYPAAEDNDLCYRLLEAGYAIHYLPDAIVYHRAWRSLKHYLPLRWSYGRGQGAFYAKHLGLHDRYMLRRLGSDLTHRAGRIFRRWRQPYGALGELIYMCGLLTGVTGWLATQRSDPT